MSKPPTGPKRDWTDLLPSVPLSLPFPGEWGAVGVIYSLQRTMGIDERMRRLTKDIVAKMEVARKTLRKQARSLDQTHATYIEYQKARTAYLNDDTDTIPEPAHPGEDLEAAYEADREVYRDASDETTEVINRLNREAQIRVACDIVLGFEPWPFASTMPDPDRYDSWDALPDLILSWIVSEQGGIGKVKQEMIGPLFGGKSAPTG